VVELSDYKLGVACRGREEGGEEAKDEHIKSTGIGILKGPNALPEIPTVPSNENYEGWP